MNCEDFIKQHKHQNYCEIVISPSGEIEYANPSHLYKLIAITRIPKEILDALIPVRAAPAEWLIEYTGYGIAWFDYFILSMQYTEEQIQSIKSLMKAGVMRNNIIGKVTAEKTLCEMFEKYENTGDETYLEQIPITERLEISIE